MTEKPELNAFIAAAAEAVLEEANKEYGRNFESWEELGKYLFPKSPTEVSRWDDRKAEIVVARLREAGNSEEDCNVLLEHLKRINEKGKQEYFQLLLSAHLGLVLAIMLADGTTSSTEMSASVEVVSSGLGISHQQVGALMEPVSKLLMNSSEEERAQHFGGCVEFIKNAGQDDYKKSCYLQYEIIANSDGLHTSEAALLSLIRQEWSLPESTGKDIRQEFAKPLKVSSGSSGCALFLVAGIGGLWTLFV